VRGKEGDAAVNSSLPHEESGAGIRSPLFERPAGGQQIVGGPGLQESQPSLSDVARNMSRTAEGAQRGVQEKDDGHPVYENEDGKDPGDDTAKEEEQLEDPNHQPESVQAGGGVKDSNNSTALQQDGSKVGSAVRTGGTGNQTVVGAAAAAEKQVCSR